MSAPAWTAGPWAVEDPLGPEILSVVGRPDGPVYEWVHIAQISTEREDKYDPTLREAEANARLIAASPELYDALVRLLEFQAPSGGWYAEHVAAIDVARAALAKARGE